jgi:hypothetical protein
VDSFIRIVEEGIGTPWQQVLLIFGCFLIAVALLGRFWLKEATPVPRSAEENAEWTAKNCSVNDFAVLRK